MTVAKWVSNNLITLPSQLKYKDVNLNPVDKLYPLEYLTLVGQDLNLTMIALSGETHTNIVQAQQILSLQTAIGTIPAPYTTPQISGQCLNSNTVANIDSILTLMINAWCAHVLVMGTDSNLLTAVGTQCANLNSAPQFTTPGASMAALTGWKATPTTIADTLRNSWLTLCDARVGISNALAATTPDCSQAIIEFAVVFNGAQFNLFFNGYTFIPSGFTDNGSIMTITDSYGNVRTQSINLVIAQSNSSYIAVTLSGSTLSPTSPQYTLSLASNISNSTLGLTCSKTTIAIINPGTGAAGGNSTATSTVSTKFIKWPLMDQRSSNVLISQFE